MWILQAAGSTSSGGGRGVNVIPAAVPNREIEITAEAFQLYPAAE